MFQMLTCFNLRTGVALASFESELRAFAAEMAEAGLVEGAGPVLRRRTDTALDTDDARDHAYFFLMDFRDKAQADAALAAIARGDEPGATRHRAVFSKTRDAIFICWEG